VVRDLLQAVISYIGDTDAALGSRIQVYSIIADSGGADYTALIEHFNDSSGKGFGKGNGYYRIGVVGSGHNLIFSMTGDNVELRAYVLEGLFVEGSTDVLQG
jgi:hypothetical protein